MLFACIVFVGLGLAAEIEAKAKLEIKYWNPAVHARLRKASWWLKQFNRLNTDVRPSRPKLLFVGDSITFHWKTEGREVWNRYYRHRKPFNIGISGDQTQHLLWRLRRGNIRGISPRVAVLLIGVNNTWQRHPPRDIAAGVEANVRLLQRKMPRTKILLLGIFPAGKKPNRRRRAITRTNKLISRLDDGKMVHYLDIGDKFLQPDGGISRKIMYDYLHLTTEGYKIWAEAMEHKVRQLLGD